MKTKFVIPFIFLLGCYTYSKEKSAEDYLVWLKNDKIEVGILKEVGARVVVLRKPGGINIFKADSNLWINANQTKPKVDAFANFKAYNGHIVWLGSQQEWWTKQEINQNRKNQKANWPPDPYIIYDDYKIVEKSDNYIKLYGNKSPVSGVQLVKELQIKNDGKVTFKTTLVGTRKEGVNWDIWMNSRMDGFDQVFAPIDTTYKFDLIVKENPQKEVTKFKIENGYFTFHPSVPRKNEQVQEVHLKPSKEFIVGVKNNILFITRFKMENPEELSPGHRQIELYNSINKTGDDTLLELEIHGSYRRLYEGDSSEMSLEWELLEVSEKELEIVKILNGIR